MALDNVLSKLNGVKPAGDAQWSARCPAHDDHRQSLSVSVGEDGRVLLHCHANCTLDQICSSMNMAPADLFETHGNGKRQVQETYPYTDETGELLFEVVRYYPKDFRQRRPDGKGGWIPDIKGVRRVPYRLPRVIETAKAGGTIYVVEGEKDVHAIEKAGGVATCNPGGVGMGWRLEYSAYLNGANVIIVADDDEPGRKHAAAVRAALLATTASVGVVLPAQGMTPATIFGQENGLRTSGRSTWKRSGLACTPGWSSRPCRWTLLGRSATGCCTRAALRCSSVSPSWPGRRRCRSTSPAASSRASHGAGARR